MGLCGFACMHGLVFVQGEGWVYVGLHVSMGKCAHTLGGWVAGWVGICVGWVCVGSQYCVYTAVRGTAVQI